MPEPTSKPLAALAPLVEKVALELVYAAPGQDNGLLPVNALLTEMEAIAAASALPSPLEQAIRRARPWVDDALERAWFEVVHLQLLHDWLEWMQVALPLAQAGHVLPQLPPARLLPASDGAHQPSGGQTRLEAEPKPASLSAEEPLQMNVENDGDLLREFINESGEHLQNIELGVLTLEEKPADADTLNAIFRAFHTFKGGSGFLNLLPIKTLAHELESLLDLARNHKLTVNSDLIDVILEGGDTLKQYLAEMAAQLNGQKRIEPIVVPSQALLARIRVYLQNPSVPAAAAGPLVVPPSEGTAPSAVGGNRPKAERPTASLPPNIVRLAPQPPQTTAPGAPPAPASAVRFPKESAPARANPNVGFVKVDTQKLDSLVDLVGEMVITQSLIAQDQDLAVRQTPRLSRNLAQLGRITNELQRAALSMRMVPIRATFQKMGRLLRDTASRVGKQAELALEGEETELDRTIVEELSDPLIHMVRNSVDHGIELPAARTAKGKPPCGTVKLRAFHQSGAIVIEIEDDGAGLDPDRLLAKALEKGLVKGGESLSDQEIFNLIFAPGFSTAAVVTDISGRGVGLDVVRKNIDKLRGRIEIQSTPGQGSTFTLSLPLTLAIIDGLIVSVGSQRYILPALAVRESFRPTADMLSRVHGRGEMVNVRGRLSPLLRLYEHFAIQPESPQPTEGIVVVVEADGAARGILVDRLIGKQEVVIKTLGETFQQNHSLAGAAILGDGRVGLILDVNSLVNLKTVPLLRAA